MDQRLDREASTESSDSSASTNQAEYNWNGPIKDVEIPNNLRWLSEFKLVLCTEHGGCLTEATLTRHLRDEHHLLPEKRQELLDHFQGLGLAESPGQTINHPRRPESKEDGDEIRDAIKGLPVHQGFICREDDCGFASINIRAIQLHCRQMLHQDGGREKKQRPYREGRLQTLFKKKGNIRYFEVGDDGDDGDDGSDEDESDEDEGDEDEGDEDEHANGDENADARKEAEQAFEQAQDASRARYRQVTGPSHVSENSNWLKRTGFGRHLEGVEVEEIGKANALVGGKNNAEEPILELLCQRVDMMLRKTHEQLNEDGEGQRINSLNAKVLNTQRPDRLSPKPMLPLQEASTLKRYSETWQRLICYIYRVNRGDYLRQDMFCLTDQQKQHLNGATKLAKSLQQKGIGEEEEEGVRKKMEQQLLCLSMSLIRHSLPERPFESGLLSFAATMAWKKGASTWLPVENYSTVLSQLRYDCQLVMMAYSLESMDSGRLSRMYDGNDKSSQLGQYLKQQCDRWMVSNSDGPMSEMLGWRLLAFSIAKRMVRQATCYWYEDGETLVMRDVTLSMDQLREYVQRQLTLARKLMETELLFGLEDVPRYEPSQLRDNWDEDKPGRCFLDDQRNKAVLGGDQSWLFGRILDRARLRARLMRQDEQGCFRPGQQAVVGYESKVQAFLEHLLVLIHVGSGMPGRSAELMGMRYQNTLEKRNLVLHDGRLVFVMPYHKAMTRMGSRYSCRFLAPAVAEMMIRFLVLVQPLRRFFSAEVGVPGEVTEYVWSSGKNRQVWGGGKMYQVLVKQSMLSIGIKLNIAVWRQMAKGIVLKKFQGLACGFDVNMEEKRMKEDVDDDEGDEEDENGEDEEDELGVDADVWHYQAGHTPHTGNQVYGGTVNFRQGLTDAALQSYLAASRAWQRFLGIDKSEGNEKTKRESNNGDGSGRSKRRRRLSRKEVDRVDPANQVSVNQVPQVSASQVNQVPASQINQVPGNEVSVHVYPELSERLKQTASSKSKRAWNGRWDMNDAKDGLIRMYGPGSDYRCKAQKEAMQAMLRKNRQELVVIMGTGTGKSLLYLLPSVFPGAGTTVVVTPLVALKEDQIRRCQEQGIECEVWGKESEIEDWSRPSLLFVSAEHVGDRRLMAYLLRLDTAHALDRVVVDECHLVLMAAEYRPCMELVKRLRRLQCQMLCLTATLPPSMEEDLRQALALYRPMVLRSPFHGGSDKSRGRRKGSGSRIDIRVERFKDVKEMIEHIQDLTDAMIKGDVDDRVLVYVLTRGEATELAESLECPFYFSDSGTATEKAETVERWRRGMECSPIMVATSAFGMGVDYAHVRMIFHIGSPREALGYVQEIGRGGRDGEICLSNVLLLEGWKSQEQQQRERISQLQHEHVDRQHRRAEDQQVGGPLRRRARPRRRQISLAPLRPEVQTIEKMLSTDGCRWEALTGYMDGKEQNCKEVGRICDNCLRGGMMNDEEEDEDEEDEDEDEDEEDEDEDDRDQDEDEDDRDQDEDEDEDDQDQDECLDLGRMLVERTERQQEIDRKRYRDGLTGLIGQCSICRYRGKEECHVAYHCPNAIGYRKDKNRAMRMGREEEEEKRDKEKKVRRGWFMDYTACFGCYNPQAVCGNEQEGCKFPETVLPLAWQAYDDVEFRWNEFPRLSKGKGSGWWNEGNGKERYMMWLGEETRLYGWQASNAAAVADVMMQKMDLL